MKKLKSEMRYSNFCSMKLTLTRHNISVFTSNWATYNIQLVDVSVLQELLKLRKKITTTVQVLTHLKEKLQFVQVSWA